MQLGILVIADADEKDAACVFGYLRRIFLALYLVDGGVSRMVEFKLHDECWLVYIAPGIITRSAKQVHDSIVS